MASIANAFGHMWRRNVFAFASSSYSLQMQNSLHCNSHMAKMFRRSSSIHSPQLKYSYLKPITHQSCTSMNISTVAISNYIPETIKSRFQFMQKMKYNKHTMDDAALRLYLCCVELIDHVDFIEELNLPDTFSSWFAITEVHLWLICTQIKSSSREGQFVRTKMMQHAWKDITKRMKLLDKQYSERKKALLQYSDNFLYNLYQYDEGLLGDDKALAAALWRGLFQMEPVDIQSLEIMVQYIRKQLSHIEQYDTESLLTVGLITFLPLREQDKDNTHRTRQILNEITKRT